MIEIYKPKLTPQMRKYLSNEDSSLDDLRNAHTGDWIKVYQSPRGKGKNATFPYVKIASSKLCGGNLNLPIKFVLLNYKSNGNHKWKGEFICRAKELENSTRSFNFYNARKSKSAGQLSFMRFKKELSYRFADYLRGGMNISVLACIDFTGSNGTPTSPRSLHYLNIN